MINLEQINASQNYFITINHLHQYAEGLTGSTRTTIILLGSEQSGFKTKADARKHFINVKHKYKNVTTHKNKGLGNFYTSPKIIKGSDVTPNSTYQILSFQI